MPAWFLFFKDSNSTAIFTAAVSAALPFYKLIESYIYWENISKLENL